MWWHSFFLHWSAVLLSKTSTIFSRIIHPKQRCGQCGICCCGCFDANHSAILFLCYTIKFPECGSFDEKIFLSYFHITNFSHHINPLTYITPDKYSTRMWNPTWQHKTWKLIAMTVKDCSLCFSLGTIYMFIPIYSWMFFSFFFWDTYKITRCLLVITWIITDNNDDVIAEMMKIIPKIKKKWWLFYTNDLGDSDDDNNNNSKIKE